MLYIIISIFIITYSLALYYWDKKTTWRLNIKISFYLKYLHYFGLFICATVAFLNVNFDIGLRGQWTTRIVIITTVLTGTFFIFIAAKKAIGRIEKWYFKLFSFLPILTAVVLFIPFLGVVMVLSSFARLINPVEKIYYEDDKLRIQSSFVGVLGPPRMDIFEKKLIFEKHHHEAEIWPSNIDSVNVSYDKDSTRIITYGINKYAENMEERKDTISLHSIK